MYHILDALWYTLKHMSRRILFILLALSLVLNVVLIQKRVHQIDSDETTVATSTPNGDERYKNDVSYPLLRVVDGDTIIVGVGSEAEYVRLIGIDTPQQNSSGNPECYALETTKKLKELVQTTGTISLHFDTSQGLRDKYGRLLAYGELPDGTDLGERMVREGYARQYTYDLPYEREERYKQAEKDAVQNTRGLWSNTVCAAK
jgi:endonuclease YncB( thermonuclease family)